LCCPAPSGARRRGLGLDDEEEDADEDGEEIYDESEQ